MRILVAVILNVFFSVAKTDSESCDQDETILTCRCGPKEDIDVYYVTSDTTASLNVFSCASANLTIFMGPRIESTTMSVKVEGVTDVLLFCPELLPSVTSTSTEFLNVKNLEEFGSECMFKLFASLDHFKIENTVIGTFVQSFYPSSIVKFILKNVTISDLRSLEFPLLLRGSELQIIDSCINVTTSTSLLFRTFDNIIIANTTFGFPYGGNIVISGKQIHLTNNTFINARVYLTGKHGVRLIDTYADGRAFSMRIRVIKPLDRNSIVSRGNRLPNQIIYVYPRGYVICITCTEMLDAIVNFMGRVLTIITTTINYGNSIYQEFVLRFISITSAIAASMGSI